MTKEDALFFLGRFRTEGINEKLYDALGVAIEALNAQTDKRTETHACDLISRQAAIDALEKVADMFPWRVPGNRDTYDRYNEAWNDAIGRAEIEIEELPSAQQWIPWGSGKLPEESGCYIVTAYDGSGLRVTFAKYQKRLKRWELTGARAYWRVLAWLPLPEPYKEHDDD